MNCRARLLAALLAALLACYALCACGAPADPEPSASGTSGAGAGETDTGAERIADALPEGLDYGNREIVILSRYREGWTSGEISVPELINEPVNDAVYDRNRTVEERLHVRLRNIEDHTDDPLSVVTKVSDAVRTRARDYDVLAAPCFTAVNDSLNGTYANLRDAQYLDLAKPWWSQGFSDVVEYHGAQYEATGAALLSMYRFSFVTIFNKNLFTETGTPFLYDAVNDGAWTLDYQSALVPRFHRDNGNNEQDERDDIYGLISCDLISVDPYWSACDIPIIKKDGAGDYVVVFDINRLHAATDKLLAMFYRSDDASYIFKQKPYDHEQDDIRRMFGEGLGAMATIRLMETEAGEIRSMKQEFGIVPMPKFDEQQEGYRTLLHDQFTVLAVPTYQQGQDLDMVGAVLEALASDSYYRVKPAYYERTLRTKIAQDPESALMLDIVTDNIYIDAGVIYTVSLNAFHALFRQIMGSRQNTVASAYRGAARALPRNLNRMIRKLNRIANRAP